MTTHDRVEADERTPQVTSTEALPGGPCAETGPFSRLVTVTSTGSTQADLRRALTGPTGLLDPDVAGTWPHLSALRALHQNAGRGRGLHDWITPPTGALTVSVVLRPRVATPRLTWLPLLAGLAVRDALASLTAAAGGPGTLEACPGWEFGTKWPNDVIARPRGAENAQVEAVPGWGRWRKIAGLLTDLIAAPDDAAPAVVLGIGVNVGQDRDELPVPWAASLRTLGAVATPDEVLDAVGLRLAEHLAWWEALDGDPDAGDAALGRRLRRACFTLGQAVEADTPAGPVRGRAVDLHPALVLDTPGGLQEVTAGEVSRLRTGPEAAPRAV